MKALRFSCPTRGGKGDRERAGGGGACAPFVPAIVLRYAQDGTSAVTGEESELRPS